MNEETKPENLSARRGVVVVDDGGIDIFDWHPEPDGQGPPKEVHLVLTVSPELRLAVRLKTRAGYERLVAGLAEHAARVWPQGIGDAKEAGEVSDLCAKQAAHLYATLPPGMGFALFLSKTRTPGTSGEPFISASNMARIESVGAMYRWIELMAQHGVGASLSPMIRQAIALLRSTGGMGMGARAITPAAAFALGAMGAIGWERNGDDPDDAAAISESVTRAIAFCEQMLAAEPAADAELAAEEAARAAKRS